MTGIRVTRAATTAVLVCGLVALAVLAPLTAATFGPAVLLFVVLLRGLRPGEALIVRLLERFAHHRRRRRVRAGAPSLPVLARPVGAARAMALAMRPPPPVVHLHPG